MKNNSLRINALSNVIALFVNVILGLIITPYLIEKLGLEKYGIWILIISVIGYYGLLDIGISAALMRYIARYTKQNKIVSLNETINTSLFILTIIGFIIIMSIVIFKNSLINFFIEDLRNVEIFKYTLIISSLSAAIILPEKVFGVIVLANEKFVVSNIINITYSISKFILFILILLLNYGLISLALIILFLEVIKAITLFFIVKISFSYVQYSLRFVKWNRLKKIWSFGIFAFISQIGTTLITKIDTAVIGRIFGVKFVGIYNIASLLYSNIFKLLFAICGVFHPRLASLSGIMDRETFNKIIMNYSIIISSFTFFVGILSANLSYEFFYIWISTKVTDIKLINNIFRILLIVLIFDKSQDISQYSLKAINKHKILAFLNLGEGVINLLLSIILSKKYGLIGVAFGTLLPGVVTKIILQPLYFCKVTFLSWKDYMVNILLKPIIIFIFTFIVVSFFNLIPIEYIYVRIPLKVISSVIVYIFLCLKIWIPIDIKKEIIENKIKRKNK